MRGWVPPLIGIPLGLALAALGVFWVAPALPELSAASLTDLLRPVLAPQAMPQAVPRDAPQAVAVVLPPAPSPSAVAAPLPVVITPGPDNAAPRPGLPEVQTGPGRVEDLLRPPPGVTAQSSGTGFFVSGQGVVMTAAHVVNGCRAIRVTSQFIRPAEAHLAAMDSEHDIALLRTQGVVPPARLAIAAPSRRTSEVFVLGYPATARRDVPDETWARLVNDSFPHSAPLETDPRTLLWLHNRDIAHGYSGGPILDPASGRVVGIVRALIDARKAAVAYGIAMADLSIGPGAAPLRALMAREQLDDAIVPASFSAAPALDVARKATVHVVCWQ